MIIGQISRFPSAGRHAATYIQANSGGGKSRLLRLIAERAGIQTIVPNNEGEFAALREAVLHALSRRQ